MKKVLLFIAQLYMAICTGIITGFIISFLLFGGSLKTFGKEFKNNGIITNLLKL